MRDLDACEAFDIELGIRLMQRAHDAQVLLERPRRVQARDDVQPREIRVAHGIAHEVERLLLRHLIGAEIIGITAERTERADVRQIHMAVHIVVDIVSVLAPPHDIRHRAEPREVVAVKQPHAVLPRQPLAIQDLFLDIFIAF